MGAAVGTNVEGWKVGDGLTKRVGVPAGGTLGCIVGALDVGACGIGVNAGGNGMNGGRSSTGDTVGCCVIGAAVSDC